jgi:hypothetical protein
MKKLLILALVGLLLCTCQPVPSERRPKPRRLYLLAQKNRTPCFGRCWGIGEVADAFPLSLLHCIFNARFAGKLVSPDEGIQPVKILIRGSQPQNF